jgi:hypothetical protein
VLDGETVTDDEVPFGAVVDVSGGLPTYHWYAALVPVAATVNVVRFPEMIDVLEG